MKDVAKHAGVSIATVSRVLTAADMVSEDTQSRVLSAIETLQYTPNSLPRVMRQKSSNVIGLVISDIANPFYAQLIRGVQRALAQTQFSLSLIDTDEDPGREMEAFWRLATDRVAGVLVASAGDLDGTPAPLDRAGIPAVMVDNVIEGWNVSSVTVDNAQSMATALDHLSSLGHRRVALISGPSRGSSIAVREQQFAVRCGGQPIGVSDLREDGGYDATVAMLRDHPDLTAIVGVNNLTTLGILRAVRDAGLRVPEDLSVVGIDDVPTGHLLGVTVVAQPAFALGEAAAATLLRHIENGEMGVAHQQFPTSLIVRSSTRRI